MIIYKSGKAGLKDYLYLLILFIFKASKKFDPIIFKAKRIYNKSKLFIAL